MCLNKNKHLEIFIIFVEFNIYFIYAYETMILNYICVVLCLIGIDVVYFQMWRYSSFVVSRMKYLFKI